MSKKFVFLDLDGTIIDHSTHTVPQSTVDAFNLARKNGHELILTTGRPPCLFNGIDKELELHNYIGANGRVAVYHDEIIYNEVIEKEDITTLVNFCKENKIDIAYEGLNDFVLESKYDILYENFSKFFNISLPDYKPGFYKNNDVYQITLYYVGDYSKFEEISPNLHYAISCKYGIDVNTKGGLKEKGIQVFMDTLGLSQSDIIAIGDGFNDIGMLEFVEESVAMGNAHDTVKKSAKYVTDDVGKNGLFNAFKKLGLLN
jgi:hypothetical protein